MLDLTLRPLKERTLEAPARLLSARVPAGALTLAALLLALASAALAWMGPPAGAVVAWWASRLADGLDGPVARLRGEADDLGGYLDMLADTVGYALIPVGVALGVDDRATYIALGFLLAAFFVNAISWSYLAAVLEKRGRGAAASGELTSVTMPPALVEGTETIVVFTLFLALPDWSAWLFATMASLVAVNVAQRAIWARRALRDPPGAGGLSAGSEAP